MDAINLLGDYDQHDLKIICTRNFKMFVNQRLKSIYGNPDFELISLSILTLLLKDNSRFVDVGGHYGYYSLTASSLAPHSEIIVFEPVEENLHVIKKNIELNGYSNIKVYQLGISNKKEKVLFNIANYSDCSGIYKHPATKTIQERVIETTDLDSFLTTLKVDLIKIDTEGYELRVIDGMRDIIKANPNLVLLLEFNPKLIQLGHNAPIELLTTLTELSFKIYIIKDKESKIFELVDPASYKNIMSDTETVNLLAFKKNNTIRTQIESYLEGLTLSKLAKN